MLSMLPNWSSDWSDLFCTWLPAPGSWVESVLEMYGRFSVSRVQVEFDRLFDVPLWRESNCVCRPKLALAVLVSEVRTLLPRPPASASVVVEWNEVPVSPGCVIG